MLHIHEEAARCLLCKDAPCTKACKKGDPARVIRAIRFDNTANVWRWLEGCTDADLDRAEQACIHYDRPIRIRELVNAVSSSQIKAETLPSLAIDFCNIPCENPFFLASSAICTNYEMVARALEMGWAGVFYKTICKQEIKEVSPRFDAVRKEGTSFAGFRNMEQLSENPYEVDFEILRRLKQNYPTKIIVASIMGQYEEEWIDLAVMAEEAGCDAVELNFSCPQMRLTGMGSDVGQNPELVTFFTANVKRNVKIPVIPKMTPNITHINDPATGAYFAGADAISAINTIKSVTMTPEAEVSQQKTISGYSGRAVKPIALRFILDMATNPILHQHNRERKIGYDYLVGYDEKHAKTKSIQLSGIGGIETWRDALEFIQLGCHNVQICTAVMQFGYRIIDDLILGLQTYLAERGIEHLEDIVGEKLPFFVPPSDLDRETMIYPTIDRERCVGCGRCYVSCQDGGHQAITFDEDSRQPHIVGTNCVGCHLCRLVCPTGAIGQTKRVAKKSVRKPSACD